MEDSPYCYPQWMHQLASPPIVFKVPFALHPCQCLLFVVFLITAILTGVRWYLIVVLIHSSLMLSDVEHTFFNMPVGHLYDFLENCLFRSSAHFLIELFGFFWCWAVWDLCIFWILTPCWIYCLQISSLIQEVAFSFCW